MPSQCRAVPAIAAAIAIAVLAALALASPAAGGSYTVRQCDYALGNGHHDFVWHEAGTPRIVQYVGSGCNEFGLAVRNGNVGAVQTYPSGGYGGWYAYAPNGTVITAFSGAFGMLSGCCISGMTGYAEATELPNGSGARGYLFQGELGNRTFEPPSGVQGPVGRGWSSATGGFAARRVGFYLRCGPGFSCSQSTWGDQRLRGRSFDLTLRDDVAPTVGAPGGTLTAGGWLRGTQTLTAAAGDGGGGLTALDAAFDSGVTLRSPSSCSVIGGRYARLVPCPLTRAAQWSVDTRALPDGQRTVTVAATDVGGAVTRTARAVAVDNTAPGPPREVAVVGGHGWRTANGFDLRWANPGGQHAPIARAAWRACPAAAPDGSPSCVSGSRAGTGIAASGPIALPAPGQWDVRVWLEDAAGNGDPAATAPPQRLRYDPDPPAVRLLAADPARPGLVTAVGEDLSGVVDGRIELRRYGGDGRWIALPTVRAGGRLTAELDDSALADGAYDIRARAVDAAGNAGYGYGGTRTLPVQTATRLTGAIVTRATRRRAGCRPARAARCRVAATVERARVRVARGTAVVARGRLTTASGRPLAGARVAVALAAADRTRGLPEAVTDGDGRIALVVRADRSAQVRLRFAGHGTARPSETELAIAVPAPVTIAADGPAIRRGRAWGARPSPPMKGSVRQAMRKLQRAGGVAGPTSPMKDSVRQAMRRLHRARQGAAWRVEGASRPMKGWVRQAMRRLRRAGGVAGPTSPMKDSVRQAMRRLHRARQGAGAGTVAAGVAAGPTAGLAAGRPARVVAVAGLAVRFRGKVAGGGIPNGGKLVEVQAHFRGRWRTISAVRSDRRGRWSFRYRFGASGRTAVYRMRARVPAEAGYPFAAGTSRPLRVTVPAARR